MKLSGTVFLALIVAAAAKERVSIASKVGAGGASPARTTMAEGKRRRAGETNLAADHQARRAEVLKNQH